MQLIFGRLLRIGWRNGRMCGLCRFKNKQNITHWTEKEKYI